MGKAGAYLEQERVAHAERSTEEAIQDFNEFATLFLRLNSRFKQVVA